MIGDDDSLPRRILENIMASDATNPMKTGRLDNPTEFMKRDQAQFGHAVISIRQVPMKSGRGSSTEVDSK